MYVEPERRFAAALLVLVLMLLCFALYSFGNMLGLDW